MQKTEVIVKPKVNLLINKAFMSEKSAFKIQLSDSKEIFFQMGKVDEAKKEWIWTPAKMSVNELGEVIDFIDNPNRKDATFFHKHDSKTKVVKFSRNENPKYPYSVAIDKSQRTMSIGELQVLKVLLEKVIIQKIWKENC